MNDPVPRWRKQVDHKNQAVRTEQKEKPLKTQRHHPALLEEKNPLKELDRRRQRKARKRQRMESPPLVKTEDGKEVSDKDLRNLILAKYNVENARIFVIYFHAFYVTMIPYFYLQSLSYHLPSLSSSTTAK